MGSTFGTYNIAYTGMYVSHAGLTSTSNNLSNVNTSGASRVRTEIADQSAVQYDSNYLVNGASVDSITRARDQLLDSNYRSQNSTTSYWAVKSGNLEYLQEIINEFDGTDADSDGMADNGLQQMVQDFFDSWEELSKDPSSESSRQAVTESATSLLSAMSELDNQLQQLQEDAVNGVKDGVDRLNELAGQVAELNQQISVAEVGGAEASYLRDQRDSLLDEMSSLANISVSETNSSFQVTIGGVTLVNGDTVHELSVDGDGSADHPLEITSSDYGCTVKISGGSIKAYMEDADQTGYESIDSTSLPYNFTGSATSSISNLRQALNDLVTTMATEINSLHSTGYGLDGSTGLDFFTAVDSSQPLSLTNIEVNPEIIADSDKIAASASGEEGDNSIADAICAVSTGDYFEVDGLAMNIDDFYEAVVSWLGTTGDNANSTYDTQTTLSEQVDSQRQTVCSISTDEEMSNMIMYQNAYSASARVLSTIDSLVAQLIEDLG